MNKSLKIYTDRYIDERKQLNIKQSTEEPGGH